MDIKDYYLILGISRTASQFEIRKKYHELARRYHPDKNSNTNFALIKFREISEAYYHLGDLDRRLAYHVQVSMNDDIKIVAKKRFERIKKRTKKEDLETKLDKILKQYE